jgi:hypothetical protein
VDPRDGDDLGDRLDVGDFHLRHRPPLTSA